ncbi:LacI family DNA-binding transcriptional regulator [Arthrobacter sp. NEB 688]|uniref:LacI family DNA-binding transcriptional regulator n=1 Tax=Arthrobacter sp. NEB 688 TaxID=904039 RepID=UPI00156794F7|nr:LacI family DNA-binding transcriptional regulator [Arthrobacter sp. NEB 688]QKE84493.1 LacI family DNA-binding transcriptional regulator [Arthrobacter sp. NEB 688]
MTTKAPRRPTLNDVARESGVSNATVSHVLNPLSEKAIAEPTRAKVLSAAARLGYVRNTAAATLRRGHSSTVLLVVDETYAGDVSARTVANITGGLADLGCTVIVHTLRDVDLLLETVQAVQPVGVMLLALIAGDVRDRIVALGTPHVLGLDVRPGEDEEAARFWEVAIGAAQVRHLVGSGHTAIGYLLPVASPRLVVARARLRGAREEADRLGIAPPLALAAPLDRQAVARLLPALRGEGVTAVCAHDDRMGAAVLAAMHDLGWRAPDDLAVVGADNDEQSALTVPALTSVAIPDHDYGPDTARAFEAAFAGQTVDARAALEAALGTPQVHRRVSA